MSATHPGIVLALVALAGCASSIELPGEEEGAAAPDSGCHAAEFSDLAGQEVSVLNDADLPENRRVLFPGALVGDETDPERLNLTIGTDDRISEVFCG